MMEPASFQPTSGSNLSTDFLMSLAPADSKTNFFPYCVEAISDVKPADFGGDEAGGDGDGDSGEADADQDSSKESKNRRESHDEAFWFKLCERYKKHQEDNPGKNISQRSFLKSSYVPEVSGEPKDCRSFSRYYKRYEMGDLSPTGTKKRRRGGGLKSRVPSSFLSIKQPGAMYVSSGLGSAPRGKRPRGVEDDDDSPRPLPKLLPLRVHMEAPTIESASPIAGIEKETAV